MTKGFLRFLRGNTLALLALFIALGGTTYAATALPKNSVGAKQLKKNAVTNPKIANGAVTGAKIANNTVKGADVLESSLGKVPSATNADNATHAATANTATSATSATTATTAQHLPALTWTPLTLLNGWTNYGNTTNTYYDPPAYTKDAEGFVHLRGTIDGSGRSSTTFASLPAGFRPPVHETWLPVTSTNAASDPHLVNISIDNTDGAIAVFNDAAANDKFVSLDGVSFYSG